MIFTIEEARDILRLDGEENDPVILPLVEAVPDYLYHAAGYRPSVTVEGEEEVEEYSPVAKLCGRFLLWLWYYGEESDVSKVERVLHNLLLALTSERPMG